MFTRFRFTPIAVALATIIVLGAQVWDINFFRSPLSFLARIEGNEIDEIVTVLLILIAGYTADRMVARRRRDSQLQVERLRIVMVTMRTVHDIVNNCLNQLQLVRLQAEGFVPQESLESFDEAIRDTSSKLKTLGELETYAERAMASGPGLEFGDKIPKDLGPAVRP